jgi:quercetin dioxygenase-like cupin family protein
VQLAMSALGQEQTSAINIYFQDESELQSLRARRFNSDIEGSEKKAQPCRGKVTERIGCGRGIKEANSVKNIEPVVVGTDVQARIFTLAPGEFIPWHRHSESTDHYFVLRGTLSISTRDPDDALMLEMGERYKITAGTSHLIANRGEADCLFLLLQGVGKYDFIKSET